MSTMLRLGPTDHGRDLSDDEFFSGDFEEGFQYELIDGSLCVSPAANYSDEVYEDFISDTLKAWARLHPGTIGRVARTSRVFVPRRRKSTAPEPDVAAYPVSDTSLHTKWQDISPLIVVEIMKEDWQKDMVRNVELYGLVPSILEYWVMDVRKDLDDPTLRVFRRDAGDQAWSTAEYAADATYTTSLLPGFELPVMPKW